MTHLTWHGTKSHTGSSARTRHLTTGKNSTCKRSWSVDDVFRRLIEITDQEAFIKSELIMDWISKARPKQQQIDQVKMTCI